MEFHLAEKTDNGITVRIKDADMTLIAPLLDRLSENGDVDVRYVEKHPDLEEPALIVRSSKVPPEKAVADAAASLADYFAGLSVKRP